jgi:hypothetical protein
MRIEVRFRGPVDDTAQLREQVSRAAHFQLGRFGHVLAALLVRVSDVNGPKGGVDKRCQVTAWGAQVGTVTVDELRGDARSAIDVAMERTARAVGRELKRVRAMRRMASPALGTS